MIPGTYAVALVALVSACRGQVSEAPPIHVVPDMDWQARYNPQGESDFFNDGRAMRPLVEGTVAQGDTPEARAYCKGVGVSDPFCTGRTNDGAGWLSKVPFDVDEKVVRRGQQRFNIYCTPCHAATGAGNGIVIQRGYLPPATNLASQTTREMSDGAIFDAITNGIRNMPSYNTQITERDRWSIVAWVRVLQRSQHGSTADMPAGTQPDPQEIVQ